MISITSIKDTPTPDPAVLFGLELAKKLRSTSKCVKAHQVVMRAVVERVLRAENNQQKEMS